MASMFYTLVIERRDGEPLDMDHVQQLVDEDYKISTWMPGHHLMTESQLRGARDRLQDALRSVQSALGEPTDLDEDGEGG